MLKISAFIFAVFCNLLLAESSVWKISKGPHTLYIGGTCHMLRASDYPLPSAFDHAYAAADTLVFEIDPTIAQDPAFAMQLLAKANYTDGRSLKSVLSKDTYAALAAQSHKSGLPIKALERIKPSMVMMMLTLQELTKAGVSHEGVDMHYHARGLEDNKAVRTLETPEFQIELLTTLGDGMEDDLVRYGLEDLEHISELFDELIHAWRSGELDTIEELFISDMTNYPALYAALLADRNQRWVPQIEAMLQTPETEFILFGVAHAAGTDGVLQRLQQQGCRIEPVTVQSRASSPSSD
jgi:uncharacterized protein YbaP (TraB family)